MTESVVDVCSICAKVVAQDDLIAFEGRQICVGCKPAFFDGVREGVSDHRRGGTGGTTPIAELSLAARSGLSGRWVSSFFILLFIAVGYVVGGIVWAFLIAMLGDVAYFLGVVSFLVGGAFLAASTGPALVGALRHFLALSRGEFSGLLEVFSSLQGFGRYSGLMLFSLVILGALGAGVLVLALVVGPSAFMFALTGRILLLPVFFLAFSVIGWMVACGVLGMFYRAATDPEAPLGVCIREGFRILCRKTCGFESLHAHYPGIFREHP